MAAINLSGAAVQDLDGGELTLDAYRGAPALVVLGNQRTGGRLPELVARLVAETGGEVPIVQIAHLRGVPRMLHWIAERDIRKAVHALRETLAVEQRRLAMGLDWKGDITSRFGFTARSREPVVALLDEHLEVIDRKELG